MLGKMNGLAGQPNRVNKYTSEDKSPCSRPARAAGVTVPGSNGRCPKRQNLPKFASPTTDARVTCCAVPDRRLKRPRSRRPSPKALRSTDSAMASPNSQAPPLAWTVVGETRPPPGPLSAIHPPAWRAHARRIRVETLAIAPRNESARPHGSEKSGFGFVNVVICARDPARRHALSSPMPISPCHCTCFSESPAQEQQVHVSADGPASAIHRQGRRSLAMPNEIDPAARRSRSNARQQRTGRPTMTTASR